MSDARHARFRAWLCLAIRLFLGTVVVVTAALFFGEHAYAQAVEESTDPTTTATDPTTDPTVPTVVQLDSVEPTGGEATIDTGTAGSLGSESGTDVTQEAVATVEDDGTVTIDQTVIVVNVGVTGADTDGNEATGAGAYCDPDAAVGTGVENTVEPTDPECSGDGGTGSADVTTGDADASGNRSTTAVHQSASGDAGDGSSVTITQTAVVVNGGGAISNTGDNTALGYVSTTVEVTGADANGGGSGSAAITTGNAQATGNLATTEIIQEADVSAKGGDSVTAEQKVVVVNLGFAYANTGENDAAGAGGGSGTASISTGDASAIGNDSETLVLQVISHASGSALLSQTIVVINFGVAQANTGSNLAAGIWTSTLTLTRAEALDQLGSLMSLIASLLSEGENADIDAVLSGRDFNLQLTLRFTITEGGPGIVIRQHRIGVGLELLGAIEALPPLTDESVRALLEGVATGTFGGREASGGLVFGTGSATIVTGDAVAAGNRSVTKQCQFIGVEPEPCFPEPEPEVPDAPPAPGGETVVLAAVAQPVAETPVPETPVAGPVTDVPVVQAAVMAAPARAGATGLALTGAQGARETVFIGFALLASGSALVRTRRRRSGDA